MNVKGFLQRRVPCAFAVMLTVGLTMPSANAEINRLSYEDYIKLESDEFVKESLEDGSLVRVNLSGSPYEQDNHKPIYRATPDYYKKFNFNWTDESGRTHTANLTDRATDPRHIIALLKEVYTNPYLPGYIEDISYTEETALKWDYYTNQKDRRTGKDGELEPGEYMASTTGPSGKFSNKEVAMQRKDHNIIKYDKQNFYPLFIDEEVKRPLNGATALLVEMKANYYGKYIDKDSTIHYSDLCGGIKRDDNLDKPTAIKKAYDYIDAVTLIVNQRYVDEGETGFLFNMEGYYSKCFVVTKGSPRPDKSVPHKVAYEGISLKDDGSNCIKKDGEDYMYVGGQPFFGMFEEFSPANNGPMSNAFIEMETGNKFVVDHNCSSVVTQQHDIIMGAETNYETRNTKFHINLMFFVPDLRFADDTAYKTGNGKIEDKTVDMVDAKETLYSPYTFYAKDHQPYFFFHKIRASIDDAVRVTDDSYENEKYRNKAFIPIRWVSNYKDIIGRDGIPESFWIYRVENGTVSPTYIPLDQIIVRPEQAAPDGQKMPENDADLKDYTWKYDENKSLTRARNTAVLVYVVEDYYPTLNGGKSYSYVIKGNRKMSKFNLVESNMVTAVLPYTTDGSYMTIELERAKSDYDLEKERNVYSNTVNLIQIREVTDEDKTVASVGGNLHISELISEAPQFENGKLTNEDEIIIPGNMVIYRRWKDTNGVDQEKVIYRLPVNKNSIVWVGQMPVIRLVEQEVLKSESKAVMGDNGLEPYRHLTVLREKGLLDKDNKKVADVKAVIAMKWSNPTKEGVPAKVPWDPINDTGNNLPLNGNLLGYFVDDQDPDFTGDKNSPENIFTVSTAKNDVPTRYYYNISFEPDDEEKASHLVSNSVEVMVASRNVYAGYIPYTHKEITDEAGRKFKNEEDIYDMDNLLLPNSKGVAVRVSNSALVKNYDVYRLPRTREARKSLVARLWRNGDGSFQPRVFDGSVIEEEDGTIYDDASAMDRPASPAGYIGKVPIELAVDAAPGDAFALVINSTDRSDSPYRDNTYGAKIAYMPTPPAVKYNSVEMKYVEDYKYHVTVKVAPENPENFPTYHVSGYGMWTYEHDKYPVQGVMYPENCVMENKWHWIDGVDTNVKNYAALNDYNGSDEYTMEYDFEHDIAKPTYHNPVVTTTMVRMYSKFLPDKMDNCITFDNVALDYADTDYYVVTDAPHHFGLFGTGATTGVDDVDIDNHPYRYFNLNGVEVDGNNLVPGIYVRTNGVNTEKVRIK